MFDTIIFSKDRAAQLHLLLQSLAKNTESINNVWILYKASDERFNQGYNILKGEFPSAIWIQETNFQQNVYHILRHIGRYFAFAVDDDILYRQFDVSMGELNELFDRYDVACLSLRLGFNCTIQYNYTNEKTIFPPTIFTLEKKHKRFLIWNVASVGRGNFHYKWSADLHIMSKEIFIQVLDGIEFRGPNSMEGALSMRINQGPPNMACFEHSVCVGVPINLTSKEVNNRHGEQFGRSLIELNDLFLEGKRPQLNKINFSDICGCHQELDIRIE